MRSFLWAFFGFLIITQNIEAKNLEGPFIILDWATRDQKALTPLEYTEMSDWIIANRQKSQPIDTYTLELMLKVATVFDSDHLSSFFEWLENMGVSEKKFLAARNAYEESIDGLVGEIRSWHEISRGRKKSMEFAYQLVGLRNHLQIDSPSVDQKDILLKMYRRLQAQGASPFGARRAIAKWLRGPAEEGDSAYWKANHLDFLKTWKSPWERTQTNIKRTAIAVGAVGATAAFLHCAGIISLLH